jgi:signal transduction histidine kinase
MFKIKWGRLSDPAETSGVVEPGLISVYRWFARFHLVIALLAILPGPRSAGHWRFDAANIFTVVWLVILVGYLSWPALQRRLGRVFLPVAFIFGSLMPLIGRVLALNPDRLATVEQSARQAFASSGQLFLALLIPLLLIGWQYSFWVVLMYVITTTLLDVGLLYWVWGILPPTVDVSDITFLRTVIFLFTGYVITRLMAAQRAQRRELAEANQQLMRYAATAEQLAVSRERNRLARELHDTLAHTLSALSVQLEAVDSAWEHRPEQARVLLRKALAGTRSGLTETRRALQALRASPLEDLGLGLALRNLAQSTAARGGLAVEVQVPDDIENLSPDVEQAVYRIAQEALSNALHHSSAAKIRLSLERTNGRLTLLVQDDGRGFDPSDGEALGHYGMRGMRERAELVGGTLHVESRPGEGTSVRLEVRG